MVNSQDKYKGLIIIGVLLWLGAAGVGILSNRSAPGTLTEMIAYSLVVPILAAAFLYGRGFGLLVALLASLVSASLAVGQPDVLNSPLVQRVLFQIIFFNVVASVVSSLVEWEREAKTKLETVLDSALFGGMLINAKTDKIVDINQYAAKLIGLQPEQLIGKPCSMFICSRDKEVGTVSDSKHPLDGMEQELIKIDGTVVPILKTSALINLGGDEYLIETFLNLTERKKVERELLRSERRFRRLAESFRDALIIYNWVDKRIAYFNPATSKILGIPMDVLADQGVTEIVQKLIHPDDLPALQEASRKSMQARERGDMSTVELEFRIYRPDGELRWIYQSSYPGQKYDAPSKRIYMVLSDITERKQAETIIQQQFQRLNALHKIDISITSGKGMGNVLDTVLDHVTTQLKVDAAAILLYDQQKLELEYAASHGFDINVLQLPSVGLDEEYAGRAVMEQRIAHVSSLQEHKNVSPRLRLLVDNGFETYFGIPLIAKGVVKGVLEIFHLSPFEPDSEWFAFLETLAVQTAIGIDNISLFEDLQDVNSELISAYHATLEGWARALELRDKETLGHTQRVVKLALKLALALGMPNSELEHLRRGALVHDIGKMAISDTILLKPGPLTREERNLMYMHPDYALKMLSPIEFLQPALDIPYCHHEKWDGSGYPRGLKGDEIPFSARIFAVVDVWDALTSDRPYRKAWPEDRVIAYIQEQSSKHFDPRVVKFFLKIVEEARDL